MESLMIVLAILMILSILVGVGSSIPSLMWIRKMREFLEKLDNKYKDKLDYTLKTGENDSIDLNMKNLSTYLSGVYFSAIIFIALIVVLIFYYLILLFISNFDLKKAYKDFYDGLDKQFEDLFDFSFDDPEFRVVMFGIAVFLFAVSFFTYVGLFVLLSNTLKTISKDERINKFYNYAKDKKIKDMSESDSELYVNIIDMVRKILDSSSTAITAFGIAGILFALILIIGGVSNV
jgi:hypothetical protein